MDLEILSVNPLLNAHAEAKFSPVRKKKDDTRVGELVVLTQDDMLDNEVYIHKMEIVNEEKLTESISAKDIR